jgi:adenosylmethionine-8-amino-7-oxononanoate aminotransferase
MACIDSLEELMRQNAGLVAGLVIEPLVQGAGGMIVQPEGFIRRVRELCDRYDILMIADEVATGFGRTGAMFACNHEGVVPDIMALSKGIAAGYLPLAATVTVDKVYSAFLGSYSELKTFFHGHTFTGNPLACAVALKSLDLFQQDDLLAELQPKISWLKHRLDDLQAMPHVGDIRQCGMAAGIELVENRETGAAYPWEDKIGIRVCHEARKRGVFSRPLGNTIVIFPPLVISISELDMLLSVLQDSIRVVTE